MLKGVASEEEIYLGEVFYHPQVVFFAQCDCGAAGDPSGSDAAGGCCPLTS